MTRIGKCIQVAKGQLAAKEQELADLRCAMSSWMSPAATAAPTPPPQPPAVPPAPTPRLSAAAPPDGLAAAGVEEVGRLREQLAAAGVRETCFCRLCAAAPPPSPPPPRL